MTARWVRTADLVGLPGMPNGPRPIQLHGPRRGWVCREAAWGARTILEWLESSLPGETRRALREARGEACAGADVPPPVPPPVLPSGDGRAAVADARVEIVAAFESRYRERPGPLVPALREWTAVYETTGAGVSAGTRAQIPHLAWNTLQRWRSIYLQRGAAGLLPGCGGRVSGIDADFDFHDTAAALLFERPRHITAKQIRRVLAARFPDRETPSIAAIQRWARRFRRDHRLALDAVADPDGHRSRNMPAFGSEVEGIAGLNALWELDSTPADVICADGGRYAVVAAIDVWSRRAKGLVAPTSRATAIAALIRRCLLDWGVPEWVRTDEGSDYTSRHVRRVFLDLGIGHQVLPPYSPDKKPFIERFIGTLSRDLFSQLPGFAGHSVADREKIRGRKSFAARRGEDIRAAFGCGLTPEQLQARIDSWCETLYGREPHAGLAGLSPFEQAASWAGERRRVDERALDALLAEPVAGGGGRVVNKDGLSVEGGVYIAAELGLHMREKVQVRRDPADYGRVFVFDADGAFVCIAEDPLRTGIDRQEVARQAKKLRAEADREARKWARGLAKARQPVAAIDDVLAAAAERAGHVVAFPAPAGEHRSDGLAAAAAAAGAAAPRGAASHIDVLKKFYLEGGHD